MPAEEGAREVSNWLDVVTAGTWRAFEEAGGEAGT
jgi:hypothetical protein